jgi:hypothetical protein
MFDDGGHLFLRCKEVKKMWWAIQLDHVRQQLVGCSSSLEGEPRTLIMDYLLGKVSAPIRTKQAA